MSVGESITAPNSIVTFSVKDTPNGQIFVADKTWDEILNNNIVNARYISDAWNGSAGATFYYRLRGVIGFGSDVQFTYEANGSEFVVSAYPGGSIPYAEYPQTTAS